MSNSFWFYTPSKTLICKWEKQGKQKITYSNSIFKRHMRYKKKNEFVMESICFCEIPNDLGGFIPPLTPQFNIAQYNQNWQFCSEKIALICRLNFWGLMNVHPFQIFNGFLNLRNERVLLIVLPLFSISKRENYKSFVYDKVAFPSPQMSTFPEFASNFRDFSSPKGVVILVSFNLRKKVATREWFFGGAQSFFDHFLHATRR